MLTIVLEAALRSLGAAISIGLVLRLMRVQSPRFEMLTWTAVLVGALVMPLAMHLAPMPIPVTATLPPWQMALPLPPVPPGDLFEDPAASRLSPGSTPRAPETNRALGARIDGWRMAEWIYGAIAGVLLLRLALGLGLAQSLCATARPFDRADVRACRVRISPRVSMPITIGRTILLPSASEGWSKQKRDAVLAHERSHLERGDFFIILLAGIHRAVFWFSPLSWWLNRRLAQLAETLSDEAAISALGDRPGYAEILLDVAASAHRPPLGVAMARSANVARRLDRILTETRMEPKLTLTRKVTVTAIVLPSLLIAAGAAAQTEAPVITLTAPTITVQAASPAPADPFKPKSDTAEIDPTLKDHLDAFVGTFQFDPQIYPNQVISLTYWTGRLYAQITGDPLTTVLVRSNGDFIYDNRHLSPRNANVVDGKIIAFDISWRGRNTRLVRVDNSEARRMEKLHQERLDEQKAPKSVIPVDAKTLDQYVGYFRKGDDQVLAFSHDGDHVYSKRLDMDQVEIFPYADRSFYYTTSPSQITFEADGDGHINMAVLHIDGWVYHAPRITEDEAKKLEDAYKSRLADERRPRTVAAVDPAQMDKYVGSYQLRTQVFLDFSREGDKFYVKVNNRSKTEVYPENDHVFFYTVVAAQISFESDASGKVTKLVLHENGWDTPAERVDVASQ